MGSFFRIKQGTFISININRDSRGGQMDSGLLGGAHPILFENSSFRAASCLTENEKGFIKFIKMQGAAKKWSGGGAGGPMKTARATRTAWLILGLAFVGLPAAQGNSDFSWSQLQGGELSYRTRSRDSLYAIAGRLGQRWEYLARLNDLQPPFALPVGKPLRINNRHLFPQISLKEGLLLNLPGRMIYLFADGSLVKRFPVAIGRPDWPTPHGNFVVLGKVKNPTWTVPQTIQEEMQKEGKLVVEKVPPGPENPWASTGCPFPQPVTGSIPPSGRKASGTPPPTAASGCSPKTLRRCSPTLRPAPPYSLFTSRSNWR